MTYLEEVFSKRIKEVFSLVEKLPNVAPPIMRSDINSCNTLCPD